MTTADQILALDDLKREPVDVPEWPGVEVHVREMTGAERLAMEKASADGKPIIALLVVHTACDASGRLLFGPDQVDAVNGKSVKALKRLFDAAVSLNKIEAAAVDVAAKN